MQNISIDIIPNQRFTVRLDDNRYVITLKATNGVMSATIVRNDVTLVQGARVVAGTPIIPYRYMEEGNFMISTTDGDLPDWTKFGISQYLLYFTVAEVEEINGSS